MFSEAVVIRTAPGHPPPHDLSLTVPYATRYSLLTLVPGLVSAVVSGGGVSSVPSIPYHTHLAYILEPHKRAAEKEAVNAPR